MHWYGIDGNYNCMVMDMLGASLEDMFTYCRRKFTVKTAVMVGFQMIQRIEYLHIQNFIH